MIGFINDQIKWSSKTFGPGKRTLGVTDHIRKELAEIEAAPDDLEEWCDVVILALDGAWRAGYSAQQIVDQLEAKHQKNFNRKWPIPTSEDSAIEHIR